MPSMGNYVLLTFTAIAFLFLFASIAMDVIDFLVLIDTFFSSAFWKDFAPNGLATLLGVVAGIPIALWLYQRQQKSEATIKQEAQEKEAQERKNKFLNLVKEELEYNQLVLTEVIQAQETDPTIISMPGLKDIST